MLAMFNVTYLADFGYNETTHFIDPMEQRYRAKSYNQKDFVSVTQWGTGDFSLASVQAKVDWFASLDAYKDTAKIEDALEKYYGRPALPAKKMRKVRRETGVEIE